MPLGQCLRLARAAPAGLVTPSRLLTRPPAPPAPVQLADSTSAKDSLQQRLEAVQAELAACKSETLDMQAELMEKSARLSHLEGARSSSSTSLIAA